MEPMKLNGRNGYGYSIGLSCWDADRGSRKEAMFIDQHKASDGYGQENPRAENYAREWAKMAWELGSARVARYRVAVSNGKETKVFTIKVSGRPQTEVESSSSQIIVDLDTLSLEEPK